MISDIYFPLSSSYLKLTEYKEITSKVKFLQRDIKPSILLP